MYIAANQSLFGNVFVVHIVLLWQVHLEQFVNTFLESLVASIQFHETIDILRSLEGEVPRVALNESLVISLVWIQVFLELAVGITWRGKAYLLVKSIAIEQGTLGIFVRNVFASHFESGGIDGPVIV